MATKIRKLKNLISTASLVKLLKRYGYEGEYAESVIYDLFKEKGIEPKKKYGGKEYFNRKNATDCLVRNLFRVRELSDAIEREEMESFRNSGEVGYERSDMSPESRELLAKDGVFGADENVLYTKNESKNRKYGSLLSEQLINKIVNESINKTLNDIIEYNEYLN